MDSVMSVLHVVGNASLNIGGFLMAHSSAIIIIAIIILVVWAAWKAHNIADSDFEWTDMIMGIEPNTGKRKASVTKFGQLMGIITSTFVILLLALNGTLTWEFLVLYLAYVGGVEAFSKFISARYGVKTQEEKEKTP